MSKYIFIHEPDSKAHPTVRVEFDDSENPFIEDVLDAFYQFLLGVTFHESVIRKYLDADKIMAVRIDMAIRVRELKERMAALDAERAVAAQKPKSKRK